MKAKAEVRVPACKSVRFLLLLSLLLLVCRTVNISLKASLQFVVCIDKSTGHDLLLLS